MRQLTRVWSKASELVLLLKQTEANQDGQWASPPLLTWCMDVGFWGERVMGLHTFLLSWVRRYMWVLGLLLDVEIDIVLLHV